MTPCLPSCVLPQGGAGAGGGGQQSCAKKVFVGGIANGTTEDDVRGYFSQFGQVSAMRTIVL